MKSWIKVGCLLALVSVAAVAIGAELPFTVIRGPGNITYVEITNNTDGYLHVFALFFTEPVIVQQAIAYGKVADAVAKIEGDGRGWYVTLEKRGLAPGGFLRVAVVGHGVRKVLASSL